MFTGISAISSRKRVPSWASSKRPGLEPTAPVILEEPVEPASQPAGGSVTLEAAATSAPPPRYQWYRGALPLVDGPRIRGAATPVLKLDSLEFEDTGAYRCVISNDVGEMDTREVAVMVELAPELLGQPERMLVAEDGEALFSVLARGSEPLSYQWFLNGEVVADGLGVQGSQTPDLRLSGFSGPLNIPDPEGFSCVVTNPLGMVESDPVGVQVVPASQTA